MPWLALLLCLFWFVSLFVVRSVVQLRRTGSTGMKGFHGAVGSLPWLAGTTASAGLVLAPLAPTSALLGWPGGAIWALAPAIHWLGAALAFCGILGALRAQLAMGNSWRIGVDEVERTELVSEGLFARVRNPIFSFMMLSALGLLLTVPNAVALAALVLTVVGIELQVRVVEEPYLLRTHGERYAAYAARVGRFLPRMGLL